MALGVMLMVSGWLLILPGARWRRARAFVGGLMVTAAMLSIVQARY
jgi:hypothetical protein